MPTLEMILAADIGGTKTRIALFAKGDLRRPVAQATYPSGSHGGLGEIVAAFLRQHPAPVTLACVGVAGPVRHGRAEATNLPWVVDAAALAQDLGLAQAWVINDLEANAYGLGALAPEDFFVLQAGDPDATGNRAVVSAGTGLGEAGLYWDGESHHPFASEGGHADFSPSTALQIDLLRWLQKAHEHVSWEHVVSGPGLQSLYRFLVETGRAAEPPWLAQELKSEDRGAVISRHALSGRSEVCVQALDLFASLYGAEAGNVALKFMATGGVFLGGGIAPRNLAKMKDGTFLRAFLAKGRMRPVLAAMPVRVILNQFTALLGSARCAARRGGWL
jgi:glucokinase